MLDSVTLLGLQLLATAVASGAFVVSLRWTWRSTPETLWTLFCASAAVLLARTAAGGELSAPVQCLLGLLGSFTCSVYWLVARGLFRGPDSVQRPQMWLAGAVVMLLMTRQLVQLAYAEEWLASSGFERATAALGEGIGLLSSTVLMIGLWEGLRGYRATRGGERGLRSAYLLIYGGAILSCTVLPWMVYSAAEALPFKQALSAICTMVVVLFTTGAWAYRRRTPWIASADLVPATLARVGRSPDAADSDLAQQLRETMTARRWYLEAELKVADLAERLRVPEYRISRAIVAGLGQANFNQWVNQHRIEHARRQLRDPSQRRQPILSIALASGFASLGPFNRAFKAQTGQTPSAYRQQCGKRAESTDEQTVPGAMPSLPRGQVEDLSVSG
ncbi:MAG: helix-turn-helix transcriptional regulator [Xanthomonadales bacterium]|nr:helix-turn-helix transcriptional regulator [Xanthomonadales bacterium]